MTKFAAFLLAFYTYVVVAASTPTKSTFIKDDEIFVATDDSAPRQITHDGIPKSLPLWSKDGTKIAFLRKVGQDRALANLVVVDNNGGPSADILIRPSDSAPPNGMRFVENVQWLSDNRIAIGGSSNPALTETLLVDPRSGAVLDDIYDDGGGPVFSPDGKHVAYEDGMPHFSPEKSWQPTLNIDDKQVFPKKGTHVVFLTQPHWSPDSAELAIAVSDFSTKKVSLVIWRAVSGVQTSPLETTAASQLDVSWTGENIFVTSGDHAWELPAGATQLIQVPSGTTVSAAQQAHTSKKVLESRIQEAGGRDADFWCESCPLASLPRKASINK